MKKTIICNLILLGGMFQSFGMGHQAQIKGFLRNAYESYFQDLSSFPKNADELTKWQADECAKGLYADVSELEQLSKMRGFERAFRDNRRRLGLSSSIGTAQEEENLIALHAASIILS